MRLRSSRRSPGRIFHSLATVLAAALCLPCVAAAAPALHTVTFSGDASSPQITIDGAGFGVPPTPSNLATTGYTGYDYGNLLYLCDASNNPKAFCAGQNDGSGSGDTIGLVASAYTDSRIQYSLGSAYAQYYYSSDIFRLQQGDRFTAHVKGAVCGGLVDFGGTPISCNPNSVGEVTAQVTHSFLAFAGYTTLTQLKVTGVPRGGKVTVRCTARTRRAAKPCPYRRKTLTGQTVNLVRRFRHRKLLGGTTIDIRITAPGLIGKRRVFVFRTGKRSPKIRTGCLAPGTGKPRHC